MHHPSYAGVNIHLLSCVICAESHVQDTLHDGTVQYCNYVLDTTSRHNCTTVAQLIRELDKQGP